MKFSAAAPAIRRALEREKDEELRARLVTALMLCGGISDEEAAAAIEAFARKLVAPGGQAQINALRNGEEAAPLPLNLSIGRILSDSADIPCPEGLAARLFERVKALRKTRPDVAKEILSIVQGVPLPIAYQFLAQRLGEGWLDVTALNLALESAAQLRQHASSELFPLISQGGHAGGVAALLLNDAALQHAVLKGKDVKAQVALLAAARYLRAALPIDLVAGLLSGDKTLAAAAEAYLIVEDSAAARRLVWARHPGEALILGAQRLAGNYEGPPVEAFTRYETDLRELVKTGGAEEVYALYSGEAERLKAEIRMRQGRAQLRLFTEPHVWRARELSGSELIELQTLLARPEVADLKPETPLGGYQEGFAEFVRVGRDGGYRVVLEGMKPAPRTGTLHEQLSELFYRFSKAGAYTTHYAIEAKLPGVEVLFADETQHVYAVCQEGGETLVLAGERPSHRVPLKEGPHWRLFKDGQLGSAVNAPEIFRDLEFLSAGNTLPQFALRLSDNDPGFPLVMFRQMMEQAKAKNLDELRAAFAPGNYVFSLTATNQKWRIGVKFDGQEGGHLMRINLQTGQEFEVRAENHRNFIPLRYLDETNKFLLASESHHGQYYLLDPASGALQPAKGEFRPLQDQSLRALQPAGKPQEFWAVIRENEQGSRVGRYDERAFSFTPVLDVPGLPLRSADVWVDEPRGKVWLTYKGHLLRLPLPAQGK